MVFSAPLTHRARSLRSHHGHRESSGMFSELIYLNAEEHLVRNFNKVETHPRSALMTLSFTCKTVAALSLASVGLASLVGWSPSLAQAVPPVFLPLQMSMNRLMVAVVDDAAHGGWWKQECTVG